MQRKLIKRVCEKCGHKQEDNDNEHVWVECEKCGQLSAKAIPEREVNFIIKGWCGGRNNQ